MLNLLKKNYLKTIIISEACWTLKIDGAFWPNLKYLNKFGVQQRTLKLKKRSEYSIGFAFHLSTFYYIYPTCKISKKVCMPGKLLLKNWGKMAPICPNQQQGPLLKISYIVCNDYTPLS